MPEVLTETEDKWIKGDYGDFLGLTAEERAIVERRAEVARLEREVIEAAKADRVAETREDDEPYAVGFDRMLATRRAFRAAVTALMEFESQQIKK